MGRRSAVVGFKYPPPADNADGAARISLTAIQEQLGLKLEPTEAPVE